MSAGVDLGVLEGDPCAAISVHQLSAGQPRLALTHLTEKLSFMEFK